MDEDSSSSSEPEIDAEASAAASAAAVLLDLDLAEEDIRVELAAAVCSSEAEEEEAGAAAAEELAVKMGSGRSEVWNRLGEEHTPRSQAYRWCRPLELELQLTTDQSSERVCGGRRTVSGGCGFDGMFVGDPYVNMDEKACNGVPASSVAEMDWKRTVTGTDVLSATIASHALLEAGEYGLTKVEAPIRTYVCGTGGQHAQRTIRDALQAYKKIREAI